jgi:hypothetical protein
MFNIKNTVLFGRLHGRPGQRWHDISDRLFGDADIFYTLTMEA